MRKKKHFYSVLLFGLKMASNDLRGCMTVLKAKLHIEGIKSINLKKLCEKKMQFCPVLLFGLKTASNDLRGCMTVMKVKLHKRRYKIYQFEEIV